MTAQLISFLLFAFVASITPGPTNILVLGNGMRHGLLRTMPLILGSAIGSAALVLLVGLGAGQWLNAHPGLNTGLAWVGACWLTWLAWQLAQDSGEIDAAPTRRSMGAMPGAMLQIVNPKTWAMALAVLGLFAGPDAGSARYALLSALFLLIAIPSLVVWATVGARLKARPFAPRAMRRVNMVLAALLAVTGWIGLAETLVLR